MMVVVMIVVMVVVMIVVKVVRIKEETGRKEDMHEAMDEGRKTERMNIRKKGKGDRGVGGERENREKE
jgi:hypothetical protein